MWSFNLAGFALAALLLGTQLWAQEPIKQRIERKIAIQSAVVAVNDAVRKMADEARPDQVESLSQFMGAKPVAHRSRTESRQLARQQVEACLRRAFEETKKKILDNASAGLQPRIAPAELQKHLGEIDVAIDESVTHFNRKRFEAMFTEARSRAVSRQHDTLRITVHAPAQKEVESALAQDLTWENHRTAFAKKLREAAVSGQIVLFEENDQAIDREVDRVLAGVAKEIHRQFSAARLAVSDSAVPTRCITKAMIQGDADAAVRRAVTSTTEADAYQVLTVVSQWVAKEATKLEGERLRRFVEQSDLPIDRALLSRTIASDMVAHRAKADSKAVLHARLAHPAAAHFATRYVSQAGLTKEAAGEAAPLITALLREQDNAAALRDKLDRILESELTLARTPIAARQVRQQFPQLTESWRPSDEDTSRLLDLGELPSDLESCSRLLGVLEGGSREVLLEEAEQTVIRSVREQSGRAVAALRSQLELLKEMEKSQAQQLTLDLAGGLTKEKILANWTASMGAQWSKRAPPTAYATLFPRTQQELEKTVSKHFNAIRQQIEERKENGSRTAGSQSSRSESTSTKTQLASTVPASSASNSARRDGQGVGGSGGGAGGGGEGGGGRAGGDGEQTQDEAEGGESGSRGKGPPPDCVLAFTDERNAQYFATLSVRTNNPGGTSAAGRCQFNPDDVSASAQQITATTWPMIERFLNTKLVAPLAERGKKPFILRIHLRVSADAVRHKTSLLVRQEIESHFQQWTTAKSLSNSEVEFHWSDSYR